MKKTPPGKDTAEKLRRLEETLRGFGKVVVCFSGGVDSSLLARVAARVLGPENVLLFHVRSLFTPEAEASFAERLAAKTGAELMVSEADVLADKNIRANGPQRCYHCKKMIMREAKRAASERGIKTVADGANLDDLSDYRPGLRAAKEAGARHPLAESGLGKSEIVGLARAEGLPNWRLPPSACHATRIPCGVELDAKTLRMVARAEEFLRGLKIAGARVRVMGGAAKIETPPEHFARTARLSGAIVGEFKKIGFAEIFLDLQGYRKGVFNPPSSGGRK